MTADIYFLYNKDGFPFECVLLESSCVQDVFYPLVPVENGTFYIDTWVIQPRIATVTILCDYNVFLELEGHKEKGYPLALDMATKFYDNLYIESMPEENTPDVAGQLIVNIKLIQYFTTNTVFSKKVPVLKGASNQPTKQVGKPAETKPKGIITAGIRAIGDLFK